MSTSPIVIILQTWERTEYALATIAAARRNLVYDGPLVWFVTDDGSRREHLDAVMTALGDASVAGLHSAREGYGACANAAWWAACQVSHLTLWLEDDWALRGPLDLRPWAALLEGRADIGMVRSGHLNEFMRGTTTAHEGRMYWKLDHVSAHPGTPIFTGHPSLRHIRYRDAYGEYPVMLPPGETELHYNLAYERLPGPAIVWPCDLGIWGAWDHIGGVKTENWQVAP